MKIILVISVIFTLISCSSLSVIEKGKQYVLQEQWLKALLEYRKAYKLKPGDIELRSQLLQTELRAADYFYQLGMKQLKLNSPDGALVSFQQGLIAKSTHLKLNQAMRNLLIRKEVDTLFQDAVLNYKAGKTEDAQHGFVKVLKILPGHKLAREALNKIISYKDAKSKSKLALNSKELITLNFNDTELKTTFQFVAKSFGINVIFDEAVKKSKVTLFAKKVTFEQALKLILTTSKTFYRQVGKNTIIIAPDTKEKHGQYEDHLIRVFHLKTIKAKEMASIIKGVISVKKLVINDEINSLLIRDTSTVISLIEKLITINDRTPAEMILDVDILEVNRTKAEQLGFDYGTEISQTFPQAVDQISLSDALSQGTVTLPAVTFRFFKQEVDAKTLANPKIRVMNNKEAKIHIGDRVPLRAATITDSLGQTRTSFEYKDIGIRLTAKPLIHLDNSVTVKLALEVSTLGQNLGTPEEPAFSIGTRNASTFMLLRDGETAILGGLIRDEERNTVTSIPGLGDIPILGALFRSKDSSNTQTDVLLTITPRVIRSWELSTHSQRLMYSGTEKTFSNKPLFDYLNDKASSNSLPEISIKASSSKALNNNLKNLFSDADDNLDKEKRLNLGFEKKQYNIDHNNALTIGLTASDLTLIKNLPVELLFNPQLMQFDSVESHVQGLETINVNSDDADKGVVRLQMMGLSENIVESLARLKFTALKPGISYLIYRNKQYLGHENKILEPRVQTSKVIIK